MVASSTDYRSSLRVGLIQTNCPSEYWSMPATKKAVYSDELWNYIKGCFAAFLVGQERPDIVLLPELALPRYRIFQLQSMALRLGIIVIAGLDYILNSKKLEVANEAVVIIPDNWQTKTFGHYCQQIRVGKIYPAPKELEELEKRGFKFKQETVYYLFDAHELGRFGVAICYDLMDLERAALYGGFIQHLFVLAYNQDTQSFFQIAEAFSRVMFCNVVICNTGHFGGSVAIAPYYRPWKRLVYRHEGARLATSQVIELPVRELVKAQGGEHTTISVPSEEQLFKNRPPQFESRVVASVVEEEI